MYQGEVMAYSNTAREVRPPHYRVTVTVQKVTPADGTADRKTDDLVSVSVRAASGEAAIGKAISQLETVRDGGIDE